MPPGSFTNVTTQRQVGPIPTFRQVGYVAGAGSYHNAPLSPKEREARLIAKKVAASKSVMGRLEAMDRGAAARVGGATRDPSLGRVGMGRTASMERNAAIDASFGGSGFGMNTTISNAPNFFSPQLSTDFLELPQSLREKREIYRHFYNTDPLVGQAIDLHTELPLSKVRLTVPKPRTCPEGFESPDDYGKYIYNFFEKMSKRIKLFQRLVTAVHHYWLDGNCTSGSTRISTTRGEIRADEVRVGDKVLTHRGRWRAVEKIVSHRADSLVRIDVARLAEPLDVTLEHPVEVVRDGKAVFLRASEIRAGDYVRITWPLSVADTTVFDLLEGVPNATRTEGGYVVRRRSTHSRNVEAAKARKGLLSWLSLLDQPVAKTRREVAEDLGVSLSTLNNVTLVLDKEIGSGYRKRLGSDRFGGGSKTVWTPITAEVKQEVDSYTIDRNYSFEARTTIDVDEDLLYLAGYWLGDGTLARDTNRPSWGRGVWNIYFGRDSSVQYERIHSILRGKLGERCVRESVTDKGVRVLHVRHHPAFIEWWATHFGGTSHGREPKRIPEWVRCLPQQKMLAFLAGLVDSDGCVSTSVKGLVSIGLSSRPLIDVIRDAMLRVGVVPSLRVSSPRGGVIDGVPVKANHVFHTLVVDDEEQCRTLTAKSVKGAKVTECERFTKDHPSYIVGDWGVGFKVNTIENLPGEVVYNLQVQEDHTFRAGFVSNHNCFIFAEDSEVQLPSDVGYEQRVVKRNVLSDDGEPIEEESTEWVERKDREAEELRYYQKQYRGWDRLILLPLEQTKVTTYSFTDKVRIELIPSDRDRSLIEQARMGADPIAEQMVQEIPEEVREHIELGRLIPLGTDPDEGSFVYHLAGRRGATDELGQSILDRCLRDLYLKEKLRQAQTQIASRAMTPKRIVWGDRISEADAESLREQVDLALVDPDYSIVANYEVHWEEMGSKDRLLDLSGEYEMIDKHLITGLGVTESLMSGETLYSGDRLKLEVINARYLFLREVLQEYVEEYLFKPVARRKGFVETDKWGDEVVLYPKLSFTRLPLRDSQDTYDALLNLYTKGSLPVDTILEMFNIDPSDTRKKLEEDMFTVNDATFNEVLRGIASAVASKLADNTDIEDRIAKYLRLKMKPKSEGDEGDNRF